MPKYSLDFKAKVLKEFYNGALAKDLSEKYGVKIRTIYGWSEQYRKKSTFNDVVVIDNLLDRVQRLEKKVRILELKKKNNY